MSETGWLWFAVAVLVLWNWAITWAAVGFVKGVREAKEAGDD